MKFKFQMESLLKFRKTQKEEALREFVEAQRKLEAALSRLEDFYRSIDEAMLKTQQTCTDGGKAGEQLVVINEFISGQKVRIERQKQEIRQLKIVVEEKEEKHLEAAKEFKIIEKLKEKRFEKFKHDRKMKELRSVDDHMVMRGRKGVA